MKGHAMPANERELLTVQDVATSLKRRPATLYAWCRDGRLPAIKIGKEWRIHRTLC